MPIQGVGFRRRVIQHAAKNGIREALCFADRCNQLAEVVQHELRSTGPHRHLRQVLGTDPLKQLGTRLKALAAPVQYVPHCGRYRQAVRLPVLGHRDG